MILCIEGLWPSCYPYMHVLIAGPNRAHRYPVNGGGISKPANFCWPSGPVTNISLALWASHRSCCAVGGHPQFVVAYGHNLLSYQSLKSSYCCASQLTPYIFIGFESHILTIMFYKYNYDIKIFENFPLL